jgi:hypothetical protein
MEQIKIVRKRSRAVPIVLTLIIVALIVAAVLFLAGDSTVERLSQTTPEAHYLETVTSGLSSAAINPMAAHAVPA